MPEPSEFFRDLDHAWGASAAPPIALRLIGSTALMLQTSYQRGTKDTDVLESAELTRTAQERLLAIAGPTSALRSRHRMYLEIVTNGLPFLPQNPLWRAADLPLRHLQLVVLDVVDVVVSKLARMNSSDVEDIEAMVDLGRVPHTALVERFRAAVDMFAYDARATDLPRFVEHLHRVERDVLGVDESDIDLPSWI